MVSQDQGPAGGLCQEQQEMGPETNYTVGPRGLSREQAIQSAGLKSRDGAGNPHTHGVTGAEAGCPGLRWNEAPEILVKECNGVPGEADKGQ